MFVSRGHANLIIVLIAFLTISIHHLFLLTAGGLAVYGYSLTVKTVPFDSLIVSFTDFIFNYIRSL